MKINYGVDMSSSTNTVDYPRLLEEFQKEYDNIYWNTIEDMTFIYRPIGRNEYKDLLKQDMSAIEIEDIVCETCLLYPKNFDFESCPAGIPTELFKLILKNSFLDSIESKKLIVGYYRSEMLEFDNQITCIISEAFPNLTIEEIESWDMAKTAKYLSRAEWKLNILRQIPIDYEVSDKLMEEEWVMQHSTSDNNTEEDQPVQAQQPKTDNSKQPKKKSPAEIAELKRKFPEINWDAEFDPSKESFDVIGGIVDTTPVALRAGY